MQLQEGGGAGRIDRSLGHGLDSCRLAFAPGHQDHLPGAQHRAEADGDGRGGRGGHIAVEVLGLPFPRLIRQPDGPGAALLGGSGLVESELALLAHADDQQVEVAGDLVVFGAIGADFVLRHGSVGDVDILLRNVDFVEKGLVEAEIPALAVILPEGVILVDGDDLHVLEGDFSVRVLAGEDVIQGDGGPAGREAEAERTVRARLDGLGDDFGDLQGRGRIVFVDFDAHFFVGMQDSFREVFLDQAALFGKVELHHNCLSLKENVSPCERSPVVRPFFSQRLRWAAVPWVKDSSTA